MLAILKKEIQSFFASPIGYLVVGVFLITNGLFLWVFKGEFNIIDQGFADLSGYFFLAPWVLIFLIPAITMKSFSEEIKQGTLELLLTKPISVWQIILGKFGGALLLTIVALIPTLLYIYTVNQLGNPVGNIDLGTAMGGYLGLVGIALVYNAIGIFTSSLTNNQIVAFISAVFLCFIMYYGFEGLSGYEIPGVSSLTFENIGIKAHFINIGRGVIDTRDIIYFLSLSFLFLYCTKFTLTKK